MARNTEIRKITHEPVSMDRMFVAEMIASMRHLQVAYTVKDAVEPRVAMKQGDRKVIGLHPDAYIMSAHDLRTPESQGGMMAEDDTYRDFIRLICIRGQPKINKPGKRGYIIDASHLELGPHSLIEDKFDANGWDYEEDGKPLRVIEFIGNSLDLAQTELSLQEHHGLILPKSELWLLREEQPG